MVNARAWMTNLSLHLAMTAERAVEMVRRPAGYVERHDGSTWRLYDARTGALVCRRCERDATECRCVGGAS